MRGCDFGRGERVQAAAAALVPGVGRSSHNYAVFNCSAHAPTMNIALRHYRAPCVSPPPQLSAGPSSAEAAMCSLTPVVGWASTFVQISSQTRAAFTPCEGQTDLWGGEAFLTSSSYRKRADLHEFTPFLVSFRARDSR